jgi:hypothetical protein
MIKQHVKQILNAMKIQGTFPEILDWSIEKFGNELDLASITPAEQNNRFRWLYSEVQRKNLSRKKKMPTWNTIKIQ